MAHEPYWITGARLADGRTADIQIENGAITAIGAAAGDAPRRSAARRLLLPGLIEGHVHLDKTFLGCAWQPHLPGAGIAERIRLEKVARSRVADPVEVRGARLIERLVARGASRIRSHVDIDPDWGLTNLDAVVALRERYRDRVEIEIVAFPQSGILVSPGTRGLLGQALKRGADLVGGLDPAGIDGDPVAHLAVVFELAKRHGKGVDLHLHDGHELGCFELRLIAEHTCNAGLEGRITVSHAFALGEVGETTFERTAGALAEAGVSILTSAPARPMPPVKRLLERGVNVFAGSDNIRDAWSPHGNGDPLERAMFVAYQQGWRDDADLELAFRLITANSARAMGLPEPAIAVGAPADLLLIEAETLAEAVAQRPLARTLLKRGRVVAGEL
jgi:cytosine/creatinine deaminase